MGTHFPGFAAIKGPPHIPPEKGCLAVLKGSMEDTNSSQTLNLLLQTKVKTVLNVSTVLPMFELIVSDIHIAHTSTSTSTYTDFLGTLSWVSAHLT